MSRFTFAASHLFRTLALASLATGAIGCDAATQDDDGLALDSEAAALTSSTYANTCKNMQVGQSGVCVLGFTDSTGFFVVLRGGVEYQDAYLNQFRALPAGSYTLQHSDGGPTVAFTVQSGKVATVKTGSLVLTSRAVADLQTSHDSGSSSCVQGVTLGQYTQGSYALLAGKYVVDYGGSTCTANELEASVVAAQATTVQY